MKKLLLGALISFFLVSPVHAYYISFDETGSADDDNLVLMDEWGLDPWGEENDDVNVVGDIFTYQSLSTGYFTETFTMRVGEGRNSALGGGAGIFEFSDIFADTTLYGTYYSDNDIRFSGGSVIVYKDSGGDDGNYDGTDDRIAELVFRSALVSELTGTLLGGENEAGDLGMKLDLSFIFDYVNPDYWGQTEQDLVANNWLLSFVGGRIEEQNLWYLSEETLLIEWDLPGMQAEFAAIPEPATMLLLGAGLIGLAGLGRRRFFKKD